MLDWIIEFDQHLLLLINGFHADWADLVMMSVTKGTTWIPMWIVALFLMWRRLCNIKVLLLTLLGVALVVLLADQFASGFCKGFFCRYRPSHEPLIMDLVHVVNGYRGGSYGFISSHAANTFGVATYLSMFYKRRYMTASLFIWAMLCSYSRMYLGVHYPGDILCGALAGIFFGYVVFKLYDFLIKRYVRIFS